jgi:hypothetical protein
MAIGTSDFVVVMPTGVPGKALIACVAIHAHFVLYDDRGSGIGTEVD